MKNPSLFFFHAKLTRHIFKKYALHLSLYVYGLNAEQMHVTFAGNAIEIDSGSDKFMRLLTVLLYASNRIGAKTVFSVFLGEGVAHRINFVSAV